VTHIKLGLPVRAKFAITIYDSLRRGKNPTKEYHKACPQAALYRPFNAIAKNGAEMVSRPAGAGSCQHHAVSPR
jgi:hypothetical protein